MCRTQLSDQLRDLGTRFGAGRNGRLMNADAGGEGVGHQVGAVEENELIGFAARRRAEPLDERVLAAGDSAHAVWYYAASSMKERLIKKFEDEIAALNHELKLELPKEIKRARELGDLRENAEYQAAKERQRLVEARISLLQKRVSEISLMNLDRVPRDKVGFGSTVTLRDEAGQVIVYQLVMPEDANVDAGLISTASPIGRALLNKEAGEDVVVKTPNGAERRFEVTKLVTIHDDN
jgi:transcription elongation factor GreA